jgi:hypothetical protein
MAFDKFEEFVERQFHYYVSTLFNKGGDEARQSMFNSMNIIRNVVDDAPNGGHAVDYLYDDFKEFVQTAHNECMFILLENGSMLMKAKFRMWMMFACYFNTRGKKEK